MRSIYCPKCDARVETEVHEAVVMLTVKKVAVRARQLKAVCPHCGELIADEEISQRNLDSAFAAYRAEEKLLSPEEIREAYAKYGLTQKSFGALLSLGGATLSRYEHGALQTKQIDAAIRQAAQPENMLALLDEHAGEIPMSQVESARQRALTILANDANEHMLAVSSIGNIRLLLSDEPPSEWNGFRKLDWNRVTQMAIYMAQHCANLGRTKLNKAMFYTDFSCFADTTCSMSGLVYVRATRGPIIDQYDTVFGQLVREGRLLEESVPYGPIDATVFRTDEEFDASLFTNQELFILENVATFVNSFATAKELSEYSHKEKPWIENADGRPLSYLYALELNDLEQFTGA